MARAPVIFGWLALSCCGLSACNGVFGIEERELRSTGGPGDDAATGGGRGACSGVCDAAVPSGWQGPVYLNMGDPERGVSCPGGGSAVLELTADVNAAPASCSCSCAPATGVACAVGLASYDLDNCGDLDDQRALTPNVCANIPSGMESAYYLTQIDVSAAGCAPILDEQLPIAEAGLSAIGCAPPAAERCDGAECIPHEPGFLTCIHSQGESACPEGLFGERYLFEHGTVDDRRCSPCSCSPPDPMSASCNEVVSVYGSNICDGMGLTIAPTTCQNVEYESAMLSAFAPTASCTASGGVAQGSVASAGTTTVCCASQ